MIFCQRQFLWSLYGTFMGKEIWRCKSNFGTKFDSSCINLLRYSFVKNFHPLLTMVVNLMFVSDSFVECMWDFNGKIKFENANQILLPNVMYHLLIRSGINLLRIFTPWYLRSKSSTLTCWNGTKEKEIGGQPASSMSEN